MYKIIRIVEDRTKLEKEGHYLEEYPMHNWYNLHYSSGDYSQVYMGSFAADAIAQAAGIEKIEIIHG